MMPHRHGLIKFIFDLRGQTHPKNNQQNHTANVYDLISKISFLLP